MRRFDDLWSFIIVVSTIAVLITTSWGGSGISRPITAFWFILICPGMALVRLLHLDDVLVEVTLALGLSLALDALVATVILYSGRWSPRLILFLLAAVSLAAVVAGRLMSARVVPPGHSKQ